jgi:drug/metabolite transporter (DMT)-like permease
LTHNNTNQVMGIREWGLIIILSILWGGSFFFVEVALKKLTPLTIVLYRVSLASLILLAIVRIKGYKMPSSIKIWGAFFIMGMLNNAIPFSLIAWGQMHIDSGLASIFNATTPIFSVILAHFVTKKEKLTTNRIIGVAVGWAGVAVLIGIDSLQSFGLKTMGQITVLTAAFLYACAAIYGHRFRDLNPLVVATGMLCCSTIIMIPLVLFIDQPWNLPHSVVTMSALFGLAAFSTSLAYLIYFKVLSTSGPTNILLVTFLIPVSAILLGSIVLGERLGWNAFIGMGMIFAGLIAIDGRLVKKIKLP